MTGNSKEALELVSKGMALYSVDNYEEAVKQLNEAISLDPYCEAAYENLGVCFIMMDKYEDAKGCFKKLLLIKKNNGLAYFHLGNIALLENKAEEAKANYSKAEMLGYSNPVMAVNLASFFEERGEYDKALEQYNKILMENPYAYDLMEKRTQLLIRIARFEDGLSSAKKMVETDIDRFDGHHYVYIALIMLKRYDEAKQYMQKVVQRFPDNHIAKIDQARLLDLVGDTQEALRILEEDFADDDTHAVAMLRLGCLLQLQRDKEAIETVENSATLKNDQDALTMLYSMYFANGQYQEAFDCCKKIQSIDEKTPQYYASKYFLPLAEKKMGNDETAWEHFKDAIAELKSVVRGEPTHIDLYMYKALCEYQIEDLSGALKDIEFLLAMNPNFAAFHLTAAIVYEALGRMDEALKHKEIAAQLDPAMVAPMV